MTLTFIKSGEKEGSPEKILFILKGHHFLGNIKLATFRFEIYKTLLAGVRYDWNTEL